MMFLMLLLGAPPADAPLTEAQVDAILSETSGPLLPELREADPAQLRQGVPGKAILTWTKEVSEAIPQTTYTLYRRYRAAGARPPYERPYFLKREELAKEAMAAWLDGDTGRLDRVNDLIWSVCEETTWVLPAHEQPQHSIDLFAAETASNLAHIDLVLGEMLPEEIRDRVRSEVNARIIAPYIERPEAFGWGQGHNNWTGVCAGSVGETMLILEQDPGRLAKGITFVLRQLERYVSNAFAPDGASLEGIGYWNYGLLHYTGFAEMLRARTQGRMDLLANERLRDIAQFPAVMALDEETFANFADSSEHGSLDPFLVARLAGRTGTESLRAFAGSPTSWRFTSLLRNLLWWDGDTGGPFEMEDAFLPESGIAKLTWEVDGAAAALAAKAGHNAEQHNHNDVGSFILRIGGTTYLCDPGPGLYSRDYFSGKRYDNIFAGSYGHSVPVIGGKPQSAGRAFCGTLSKENGGGIVIRFEEAYDVPELVKAERRLAVGQDGALALEDCYTFQGGGLPVQEVFVTWEEPEADGNTLRISGKKGVLTIEAQHGVFAVERLESASKENRKDAILKRITVDYPAATEVTAQFRMTWQQGAVHSP